MLVNPRLVLAAVIFWSFFVPGHGLAKSWDDSIADVETKAEKHWNYAIEHGGYSSIGTVYNEIGVPEHECTITGRRLGLNHLVHSLEEFEEPALHDRMTEQEIHNAQVFSVWLSNWAFTARRLKNLTSDEIKQIWNLNCVGRHGIPSSAFVEVESSQALFRQKGELLFVLGDIDPEFYDRFQKWLNSHPETKTVVLGSGGGNVVEAINVGRLIRSRGLETTLSEYCYSACPLVFLGGVNRTIWSPYPKLGFHQISLDRVAVGYDDPIYRLVGKYVLEMGANADFVLLTMRGALPSEMSEPDLDSLCDNRVATFVQRLCHAGGSQ